MGMKHAPPDVEGGAAGVGDDVEVGTVGDPVEEPARHQI